MKLRLLLRTVAVVIAVLGVLDPAVMLARRARQPLVIATGDAHGPSLASVARIREALEGDYDVRTRSIGTDVRVPACGAGERCVLVGGKQWPHGTVDARATVLGAIQLNPAGPGVAIHGVAIPATTYARAVGRLLVELIGHEVVGAESAIDVYDGDVPVGHAVHRWGEDGRVTVPVEWWPVASGPRQLSIRTSLEGRHAITSDRVDVGVEVESTPFNVLVYDTRPSWTSTFVRRALEDDSRFALRVVAGVSPRIQVTEGAPFRLDEAPLTEASAVIIGAPEDLSAREVGLLERFVRVRGGSLILVPDRRPTGPIVRLLPMPMTERLEPAPVTVGEWRASELLLFSKPDAGHQVLAKAGETASVIAAPSGAGRIVISGVMDAWRYRDADDAAFDRAWQSLIADAAMAGGRPVEITLDRRIARPTDDMHVTAHVRSMAPVDAAVAVSATVACGQEPPRMVRLWPTGDRRRFEGRFVPGVSGTCNVAAFSNTPGAATDTASLLVRGDIRQPRASGPKPQVFSETLGQLTGTSGGRVFTAGDEASLASDVRRLSAAEMVPTEVRLMRSPWWIVPFAGCLGIEWWLRRRQGLR